ncbi:MAG: hypothetical protein J6D18_01960, partial [Erysipelotrichaceae bacterium]|nr:hypothetical protein [Erysipelotrichaceae bacterium]
VKVEYEAEPLKLLPTDDIQNCFFVRTTETKEKVEDVFGKVEICQLEGQNEYGFWTGVMSEAQFKEKCGRLSNVIKYMRLG